MQEPNSYLSFILKGRYFVDVNIMNAKPGTKPSYVWLSLLQGRDLLRNGLRYIIGDGTMVNAWLDPWLDTTPPRAPRKRASTPYVVVFELMDHPRQCSRDDLLQDMVIEEDIPPNQIVEITANWGNDYWVGTLQNGIYSVNSGYYFCSRFFTNHQINPPPGNQEIKNLIWKLNIPPKIHHFLWKFIANGLTTRLGPPSTTIYFFIPMPVKM